MDTFSLAIITTIIAKLNIIYIIIDVRCYSLQKTLESLLINSWGKVEIV